MAVIDTLKAYETLRQSLEDKQARVIAEVLETSFENYSKYQKEFLVTKEEFYKEISSLRAEMAESNANLRSEIRESNTSLRAEMKEANANLRAEMKEANANLRAELIKWMFIFWTGQIFAMLGILFAFFKK